MILLTFLYSCILLLLSWIFLIGTSIGVGLLWRRIFRMQSNGYTSIFFAFWEGWAIQIVLLQAWNLWLPVNYLPFFIFTTAASVGIFANRKALSPIIVRLYEKDYAFLVIWLLSMTVFSVIASGPPRIADSGLYYTQSIRWIMSYPVVPGLANLCPYFAYNHISFLYAAMLDSSLRDNMSPHIVNGILLSALSAFPLYSLIRLKQRLTVGSLQKSTGNTLDITYIFGALLAPAVFWQTYTLADVTPDLPMFALGIVITLYLILLFIDKSRTVGAAPVVFLATTGTCIKISFGIFALTAALAAYVISLYRHKKSGEQRYGILTLKVLLAGGIPLTLWTVRNVFLSGYAFFPLDWPAMDMDWRFPKDMLEGLMRGVREAKQSQSLTYLFPQLLNWSNPRHIPSTIVPLAMFVAGGTCCIFPFKRKTTHQTTRSPFIIMMLPAMAAIVVQFVWMNVLDVRYLGSSLWILGAGMLACGLLNLINSYSLFRQYAVNVIVITSVLFSALITYHRINKLPVNHLHPSKPRSWEYYLSEAPHPLPDTEILSKKTDYGLIVHIPKPGFKCWDTPFPCSPFLYRNLTLRKNNDLSSGFRLNKRRNAQDSLPEKTK